MLMLIAVLIVLFQPIIVPVAYAIESWTGDSWTGESWNGESWDGSDLKWEGNTWNGETWSEDSWNGEGTEGSGTQNEKGWNGYEWDSQPWYMRGWKGDFTESIKDGASDLNTETEFGDGQKIEEQIEFVNDLDMYYNFSSNALPGAMSWWYGHSMGIEGNNIVVKGPTNIKGNWSNSFIGRQLNNVGFNHANQFIDDSFNIFYQEEIGINNNQRVYDIHTTNSSIRKNVSVKSAMQSGLSDTFGKGTLNSTNNLRGGGIAGHVVTLGSNFLSFGWGEKAKKNGGPGVLSTDFGATLIVDSGLAAGITVVSSVIATLFTSVAVGTLISPGIGTIIGAGVGLLLSALLLTKQGQKLRNWTIDKVKSGLDWYMDKAKTVWKGMYYGGKAAFNTFIKG